MTQAALLLALTSADVAGAAYETAALIMNDDTEDPTLRGASPGVH